jgi:exosortase A-associated hydrolase 2
MSPIEPTSQSASYVQGRAGALFRLVSEPMEGAVRGTVLWAHAFAEEMNKSRRMCARMARSLAGSGMRVVQIDLAGCGDSTGELRDVTWRAWTDDLRAELALADRQQPCWLWAVRAGALFAPELTAQRPDLNLLLWQPALSGAQVLQQFLRLHAGARVVGAPEARDDNQSPARLLKEGQTVEVGGYEISPALATGLQRASLDLPDGHTGRVLWLEVSAQQPPAAPPPARELAQRLRERGVSVHQEAIGGPQFWQTQEIEDNELLLERSLALVQDAEAECS